MIDDESSGTDQLENSKPKESNPIADENTRLLQKHVEMCSQGDELVENEGGSSYFEEGLLDSGNFDQLNQVVNLGDLRWNGNKRWLISL